MTITTTTTPVTPDTTPGTLPVDEPDTELTDAVAKGIELLDSRIPGWAGLIDVSTLDLSSSHACVLGQTTGDYYDALEDLGIEEEASDYGFNARGHLLTGTAYAEDYIALTALWAHEVTQRQQAD